MRLLNWLPQIPIALHVGKDTDDLASEQALDVGPHLAWQQRGCKLDPVSKAWRWTLSGGPCLLACLVSFVCQVAHGVAHLSRGDMMEAISLDWFCPNLTQHVKQFLFRCATCNLTLPKEHL